MAEWPGFCRCWWVRYARPNCPAGMCAEAACTDFVLCWPVPLSFALAPLAWRRLSNLRVDPPDRAVADWIARCVPHACCTLRLTSAPYSLLGSWPPCHFGSSGQKRCNLRPAGPHCSLIPLRVGEPARVPHLSHGRYVGVFGSTNRYTSFLPSSELHYI